jgi:acetylornithine deacetylase/succinyl-diaminopimelate desuccinylase-like protein
MQDQEPFSVDRRTFVRSAAAGAALTSAAGVLAAPGDRAAIRTAVEAGREESIKRIRDWIALPSIAAESLNMEAGVDYMMRLAREAGFQHIAKVPTDGHPGMYATLDVGAKRWMGIYFMYDVKQFDPKEWSSPPLEGRIVDMPDFGKVMIGRGAANQKGPQGAFLAAMHAFRKAGRKLPVNLVLVAEGEEEIGSPHFNQIVQRPDVLAALKKCEGVIIPSNWQDPSGSVQINLGAKGIVEFELIASGEKWGRGPRKDIHSRFMAQVDSPVWRLVSALHTLVTPEGNVPAIDGLFDKVRPLTAREKALIAEAARQSSEEGAKRDLSVSRWIDDLPWAQSMERLTSQPTVNIEGLVAGYTGPGGMTILPSRAVAKIDMRLVPNMTKDDTLAKVRAHLDRRGFADIEMKFLGGYDPTETAEDARIIRAQRAVYSRAGVPHLVYPRLAGGWPGFAFTSAPVSLPAGQFGLGLGSRAHAPDEYYVIDSIRPKVAGLTDATMSFVDYLYEIATIK